MSHFLTLLKINIKLLLRNKGFLFFLVVTPILSVFILGLKIESATAYTEKDARKEILELGNTSSKAIYYGDSMAYSFIVKVYDSSKTELSEYVLKELAASGMFCVCRLYTRDMTEKEIFSQAEKDAFNDRAGIILHIKKDFDESIAKGDVKEAVVTYEVSEDERSEIFKETVTDYLEQIYMLLNTGMEKEEALRTLRTIQKELPMKKTINLEKKEGIVLDKEQNATKDKIGYAFAVITLGFLFCGVCVAYTVIEEQENKVYTRIMLSGINTLEYLAVKLVMAIIISAMQTGVLGLCMYASGSIDLGINNLVFITIIFMIGLVFSILSLCVGVLLGDVMNANYAVFSIWSISSLLAGLYFPLDNTSNVLKAISFLMPQKWFMKVSEMLLIGDKSAWFMLLYVTVAYFIVITSIGGVGLKIMHQDN